VNRNSPGTTRGLAIAVGVPPGDWPLQQVYHLASPNMQIITSLHNPLVSSVFVSSTLKSKYFIIFFIIMMIIM